MAVTEIQSTSRIAVVGTGYVGLTTGACFAQLGHDVVCARISIARKVDGTEAWRDPNPRGRAPGHRPGEHEGWVDSTLFSAPSTRSRAASSSTCVSRRRRVPMAVRTSPMSRLPPEEIAPFLDRGAVVVNKSTVPVGSTLLVERAMERPDVSGGLEPRVPPRGFSGRRFLEPGSCGHRSRRPRRSVAGRGALPRRVRAPILITDPASAPRPDEVRSECLPWRPRSASRTRLPPCARPPEQTSPTC